MDVLALLVSLAVIGFALWVIVTLVPMPEPYRRILVGLVVLIVLVWFLRMLSPGFLVFPRTP